MKRSSWRRGKNGASGNSPGSAARIETSELEKWRELEEMFQLEEKFSEKREGEQEKEDVLLYKAFLCSPDQASMPHRASFVC